MKVLDQLLALVALIGIWGMVYVFTITPLYPMVAAKQDREAARLISAALIARYRENVSSTLCPLAPVGVSLQSLVDDGYITAELIDNRAYSADFNYINHTVSVPGQPAWDRTTGVNVFLTYSDVETAREVASAISYDQLDGNTLVFFEPVGDAILPRMLSHVDPATGCVRRLND